MYSCDYKSWLFSITIIIIIIIIIQFSFTL